ncbi:MAG: toxin-antitoxin system YwqK family antitoxin [Flavobacteriaceae bacterium]|nr:toxin-antitoxin system YwqK family antitoxin [Flavobacteriaceae bacterium]
MKRLVSLSLLFFVLFGFSSTKAQRINQFDKNKKRTGVWKKYHSNKRVRYVGKFNNGKEVGTFRYYDITTSKFPTIIKEFSATSDSAFVRYFTLNGKLRTKGTMVGKKRVGKWIYYFPKGKLFPEEFYVDGKLEGELKNYYENGKTLEITQYSNGMKNGFSKKHSDKGVLIEEVHYKNDVLDGEGKYYELNGDLKEEGIYRNGKRYGKWQFYIEGKKATQKQKRQENKIKKSEMKKKDEDN